MATITRFETGTTYSYHKDGETVYGRIIELKHEFYSCTENAEGWKKPQHWLRRHDEIQNFHKKRREHAHI